VAAGSDGGVYAVDHGNPLDGGQSELSQVVEASSSSPPAAARVSSQRHGG
jgi:hypothetical protein